MWPALDLGVAPSTIIMDLPVPVQGWNVNSDDKKYPDNYGGTFSGPITMREAFYRSVNNAAARVLMEHVGLDESYRTLETLGISSSYINKDGSGLALGTSDISVIEMAVAYGAIGNSGVYREPVAFTKVEGQRRQYTAGCDCTFHADYQNRIQTCRKLDAA